jgi:hypothetical protein
MKDRSRAKLVLSTTVDESRCFARSAVQRAQTEPTCLLLGSVDLSAVILDKSKNPRRKIHGYDSVGFRSFPPSIWAVEWLSMLGIPVI